MVTVSERPMRKPLGRVARPGREASPTLIGRIFRCSCLVHPRLIGMPLRKNSESHEETPWHFD